MKIADIIRGVLDMLDRAESMPGDQHEIVVKPVDAEPEHTEDSELLRMRQIAGLIGQGNVDYSNSPEEKYADIEAVIASGDDVHKSKHPSDIRGDSISMYPGHQHRPGA
jgi:hypothetical protein